MSDRDPFEELRDLIDEPVAPRAAFAGELRSRLMRELSASDASREEHPQPMDAVFSPRPPSAFPIESPRRIRPMVLLELAAAAVIILGLAATLGRGWFGNDPDPATTIPAAALQGGDTPTPELPPEQTPTPEVGSIIPTVAPDGSLPSTPPAGAMIPTVSPDGTFYPAGTVGTLWSIPGPDGDIVDFGGLLVEDGIVYRLLATSSFVGVQAVDGETGAVLWQQAHQWAGNLFAIADDTLYFDGSDTQLIAMDATTGAEKWSALVDGNPIAIAEDDDSIYVLLDTDFVAALDASTGEQRWSAQGTVPQNPAGGSASIPAIGKIAVDNGVVAAISTYGVLSGFDASTGKELWSHEGFDAATVSIATEDDRFIVTDGAGPEAAVGFGVGDVTESEPAMGTPGEEGESVPASVNTGGAAGGTSLNTGAAGPGTGCGVVFGTASGAAGAPSGTPEAGVTTSATTGTTFRVQGIDPKTGEIVWAQQTAPGKVAGAMQGGDPSGLPEEVCSVDVESGVMTSGTVGGNPGTAGVEEGHDAVGSVSSGVFIPAQAADDDMPVSVSAGAIAGFDQPAIAVATDDDGIYLQLQDGTLVKIDGGQTQGEAGHQANSDDDHSEGTTESDDDHSVGTAESEDD
jgi:outer membrane protein assembly factor BamB